MIYKVDKDELNDFRCEQPRPTSFVRHTVTWLVRPLSRTTTVSVDGSRANSGFSDGLLCVTVPMC